MRSRSGAAVTASAGVAVVMARRVALDRPTGRFYRGPLRTDRLVGTHHKDVGVTIAASLTDPRPREGEEKMAGTTSDRDRKGGAAITTPPRRGIWRRCVHPRLLDIVMDTEETRGIRERVCAPLSGEVLEIGFGTGLNLPALPDAVTRVLAVDPLHRAMERAAERVADSQADVQFIGPDAQHLPLDDASVDTVLCTWSLCSIDDPVAAVTELARVLRPGGQLHLVEHGWSPDSRVQRWQRRLDGPWSRFAGGCHVDRDIPTVLEQGGLHVTSLEAYYTESEPRFLGWTFEGLATRASAPIA